MNTFMPSSFQYSNCSVFFKDQHCLGTEALVVVSKAAINHSTMLNLSRHVKKPAHCFTWPEPGNMQNYRVRCFNQHNEIQCCGHGLLACAYALKDSKPKHLCMGSSQLPIHHHSKPSSLSVGLPLMHGVKTQVPSWAQHIFHFQPIAASIAGDKQGYLILEFCSGTPIKSIQPDIRSLEQLTSRAVIITQWVGKPDQHYNLRYFAPQYGIDEDLVTGSAQRVLASYWNKKKDSRHFNVIQCSAQGGAIEVNINGSMTFISGKVSCTQFTP